MENKIVRKCIEFYFLAVAVLMYYFLTEVINLGLFITYRHMFALVLAASAVCCFLYKPDVARGATAVRAAFAYRIPMIVTIFVSLVIWFVGQVDTAVISRGLSGVCIYNNMLSFSLAGAAFLYIFGEKGIWYNLIAVLAANLLMILTIIANYGIGSYFSEFIALIMSFAAETGDIIVQAEIHELAFCLGAYIIYMFLKPRKSVAFWILFGLTMFCFVSAFKRIGIIAIAVALMLGWFLMFIAKFKKETASGLSMFLAIMLVVILIVYIALIKSGAFSLLEQAGIDTSGRVEIYNAVDKFYEFSPDFIGNGIGFLTYNLSNDSSIGVASVHNDFLQYFIDLGFWGYILWLVSMTITRVRYFGKNGQTEDAIIAFSLTVYLFIVSSTDNTMNYPLVVTVLGVIMIGNRFDEKVRKTEEKMYGSVSETNREKEGLSIL